MFEEIVLIDIQGFKFNSNNFIAKEIAILFNNNNNSSKEHINFIIKPPFDFKRLSRKKQNEANWLIKNYHHLKWGDGSITFKSVVKFLRSNLKYSTIIVKGMEKKKWFEKILQRKVFNIEDIGCINFKQMYLKYPEQFYCGYHNHGVCALRNVYLLRNEKFNNLF